MKPYRAIPINGKDFVYGWYYHNHYVDEHKIFVCIDHSTFDIFDVDPETVGQQVGLKDKNSTELDWWKGDIIEDTRPYTPKRERFYEIVFRQGCFWLKSIHGNLCLTCECLTSFLHIFNKVGNIHQEQDNA